MADKQVKPPNRPPKTPMSRTNKIGNVIVVLLILSFIVYVVLMCTAEPDTTTELDTSTFIEHLEKGHIESFRSKTMNESPDYEITGTFSDAYVGPAERFTLQVSPAAFSLIIETWQDLKRLDDPILVDYDHEAMTTSSLWNIIAILLPILLIVFFIFFFLRSSGGNRQAFDFGKSRARINRGKTTTFKHVAGADEEKEELEEIIDFLKTPQKYITLGARIPKGILLVGPPGTGKTLLARAVAGEAEVPFYSISGSDFVEMFVGVGASRVRDMFKTAKQTVPCIIFIDEIDAVGRQRGTGLGGGHDEREQTLNQLLVEMDGFGVNSGIIVIAATNRPDVLDPALLRAGRFDRQITINRPDIRGRKEILAVHARNKRIDKTVTFEEIARRTPGFTGADLENLLNEAALLAARESKRAIRLYHIDEAIDRVMMGPAKKSRIFSKRERDFIAHHEAGHAVLGTKLENANVVHKVTIIPRGQSGGYNLMLPEEEESFLMTRKALIDQITGLLGGRVAEELVFDEVSTGAHNDFQRATEIARAMVTEYGMSSLGPIQYEKRSGNVFLGRDYSADKSFSDTVALEIDTEVRKIINEAYEKAKRLLTEHMDLLKKIAAFLLEVETLNREDIMEIVDTGKLEWLEKKREKDKAKQEQEDKEEKLTPRTSEA